MDRADAIRIFTEIHPDHFKREWVLTMPEETVMTELVLDLRTETPQPLPHPVPDGVTFGLWHGSPAQLRQAAAGVNPYWIPYYEEADRVFCAFGWDGLILALCIPEDMGVHTADGEGFRIAGPGCVGTLPPFRRQGIGLAMVREATLLLQEEGYDLSWIHYTHLPDWYAGLGYRPLLRWNGQRGFL